MSIVVTIQLGILLQASHGSSSYSILSPYALAYEWNFKVLDIQNIGSPNQRRTRGLHPASPHNLHDHSTFGVFRGVEL